MKPLAERKPAELRDALAEGRLGLHTGPLTLRVQSGFASVADALARLYAAHPSSLAPAFADFHIEVAQPRNLRRVWRPQALFKVEGELVFEPLPAAQAPALFEWGLNWVIAAGCSQWLVLHAASLERNGRTLVLPAPPGSGKSTLCAALAQRGWRLMSDELTLIDPLTLRLHALARPINLKNDSIPLLKAFAPEAAWSPSVYSTQRGWVTHMQPPPAAVARMHETAAPGWVVFPRWAAGEPARFEPLSALQAFQQLAANSFNYSVHGENGCRTLAALAGASRCLQFRYATLDEAIEAFDWLAEDAAA